MAKDVYLQPDAPDPIHSEERVLSIVRRHVPSAKAMTGVDESGGEARTYAVDDTLVLKVQRPHQLRPRTSLEKEAFFLRQLSEDSRISVPTVLGYGRDGDIEYTVMTRMPGVAIVNTSLRGEPRAEALFALGQTLRNIHSVSQGPLQSSNLFPGDQSFQDVAARFRDVMEALVSRIHEKDVPWTLAYTPEQVMERALMALPYSDARVALHSNPGPTHTFVDTSTKQFTGLIDFGDAYISHPAWDLWRWNLPIDREALLAGYTRDMPVDATFLKTWHVVMIVADMMAIAYQTKTVGESTLDLQTLIESLS